MKLRIAVGVLTALATQGAAAQVWERMPSPAIAEGVFVDVADSGHDRKWQLAWQDLLGRSVAYAPDRRPDSAVAFAAELADVLERHPPTDSMPCPARFGGVAALEGPGGSTFARVIVD